ncbi:MAG: nitroreductase family protein [Bacteroidales bacterium]|nr:nitroreductase family protein [Bacteroidales bacterium]
MKKITLILLLTVGIMSCTGGTKTEQTPSDVNKEEAVIENILSRRSVRSYLPDQLKQEQLDVIMKCAINAPSAMNKQSWQVRVVQNQDLLKSMNKGFVESSIKKNPDKDFSSFEDPKFSIYHNAPTVIFVARDKNNAMSEMDCGLLVQNILLSAEAMDIGTCVLGGLPRYLVEDEALLAQLELPDTHELSIAIAMGYKNERPAAKPRDPGKVSYIR